MADTNTKTKAKTKASKKAVASKAAPKVLASKKATDSKEKVGFKPGNRKYTYKIGRRKRAIAQIRMYGKGSGVIVVNKREFKEYFPTTILQQLALLPLTDTNQADIYDISVLVRGGGIRGQADAIRLAIARAIVENEEGFKSQIKKAGYLTRDSRVKERKKYGLKRARRAPQWSKR